MIINPFDQDELRQQVREAQPFPHFCLDGFLQSDFADEVLASFPSFQEAERIGRSFSAVNERNKIQITDANEFPQPISLLHEALSSQEWLNTMSYVMDIPELLADPTLSGGGIHETGPRGHLDVHVDFNYLKEQALYRRLNILIYFNKDWDPAWGGNVELWDRDVKVCHHSLAPVFNRCVVFATSEISYHGVTAVNCPPGMSRKSFAAYYYTRNAPDNWSGESHSTVFKARPDEKVKALISMPAERLSRSMRGLLKHLRDRFRGK